MTNSNTSANNNLAGSLTEEIGTLEKLQRFDVYSNSLIGTMPHHITNLTDLVLLDIEENGISGLAFPDNIFDFKSLIFIGSFFVAFSIINRGLRRRDGCGCAATPSPCTSPGS